MGTGNTNFGEHWSKSPGDSRAVARLARRRQRKTDSRPISARRGFRRACDGSTKFRGCQVSIPIHLPSYGSYLTPGIMYFHSNLAISEIQSEIFSYCDGLVSLDTSLCEFIKSDAASAISNMTINKQEPRQDFIIEVQVRGMRIF